MLGARRLLGTLLTLLALLTLPTLPTPAGAAGAGPVGTAPAGPAPEPTVEPTVAPTVAPKPDPRWVFYTDDERRYTSPWFGGARRVMIPFGCTAAPYYSPDPRCAEGRGFHHGVDIAMPCGTRLYSDRLAWVVSNDALGPAYGAGPLLLRNHRLGFDLVIGHVRRTYVDLGDRVRPGTLIARASDDGAPDGCHLHFEVRAEEGELETAVRPRELLELTVKRRG